MRGDCEGVAWPAQPCRAWHRPQHLLPLYLGTQRTLGSRPLMLKCFPSYWAHCSSRKSRFCARHGSVLQDLNFILRPVQYLPPFFGLSKGREHTRYYNVFLPHHALTCDFLSSREVNLKWPVTKNRARAVKAGFAFCLQHHELSKLKQVT